MAKIDLECVEREVNELDERELDLVSGGERSLGDVVDRLLFAVGCVLGGNTLTVKGDQLQCRM